MAAARSLHVSPSYLFSNPRRNVFLSSPCQIESFRNYNFQPISLPKTKSARIPASSSVRIISKWQENEKSDRIIDDTASKTGNLASKVEGLLQTAMTAVAATACSVLFLGASSFSALADSETSNFTVTFPGSSIPEVSRVQKTLVEAWAIVEETFWDSSFNNQDWEEQLSSGLSESLAYQSAEEVYAKVRGMLGTLGDPFTRIITPQEYQAFRISNDGALEGVGLLIGSEPDTGRLIVLRPIEGGPAARAGIQGGDELVQIDDEDLAGLTGEQAATRLRGRAGTEVNLTVRRPAEGSYEQAASTYAGEITHVHLKRETITLSPVFAMMLQHEESGQQIQTGYIRLTAFSQNAAADMERAVARLESEGASNYILDLRNNPGGLVKAGLDVAQIWLDGNDTLVNTIDRAGNLQNISLIHGHALTHQPLAVLVNQGSASASEILAGALHDNGRATLIGENTYGKGKIQSVFELNDGSALFVTVAKYLSPNLHQIDQVGIAPDLRCTVEIPASNIDEQVPSATLVPGSKDTTLKQPLILKLDPASQLQNDSCVLTAEKQLLGS